MDELMGSWFKYVVRLLGLAALVAILIAVFAKSKAQTEVTNLTQLASSVQNAYTGQATFTGLTTTIAANVAPAGMVNGTTLVNQWGGSVTVQADTNAAQFDIVENSVPSAGCIDLVQKAQSYVQLTLNGANYTVDSPLSAGDAITGCKASTSQTITFVFGH